MSSWFWDSVIWADAHSGAVMAVLTLIYSVATIFIYFVNRAAVREMRLEREEETSPYVTADLETDFGRGTVEFVVRNIGKTPAYNVRIISDPPLKGMLPDRKPLAETALFKKGLPTLQPGQEIRAFFGMWHNIERDEQGNLPVFHFRVSYEGVNRRRKAVEYISDFNVTGDITFLRTKGLHELVNEVQKLRKEVEKLRGIKQTSWAWFSSNINE